MTVFEQKSPAVMSALMMRFALKDFQAAGILGNLGHESGGFVHLHEIGAAENEGGYGWGQWTGPRRVEFMRWCVAQKLGWESDEANLGYLVHELTGEYRSTVSALLKCQSLTAAVLAFERNYERAGVPAIGDRVIWGQKALNAYHAAQEAHDAAAPQSLGQKIAHVAQAVLSEISTNHPSDEDETA